MCEEQPTRNSGRDESQRPKSPDVPGDRWIAALNGPAENDQNADGLPHEADSQPDEAQAEDVNSVPDDLNQCQPGS